jgi:hypothetical protein
MNEEILYNKYYENFASFKEVVLGFLGSLADPPIEVAQKLAKRITDSFRAIGKIFCQEKAHAPV